MACYICTITYNRQGWSCLFIFCTGSREPLGEIDKTDSTSFFITLPLESVGIFLFCMALINCSNCGAQISDKSGTCIHCGTPIPPKKVMKPCPECSTMVEENVCECPECGYPIKKKQEVLPTKTKATEISGNEAKEKSSFHISGSVIGIIVVSIIAFCLLTWINNLSYDASGEEGLNWSLSGRIIASINIGFLLGSGKMLITMLTASFDFGWWICHDYSLLWGIVAGVIFFIVILIRYEFDKVEEMEDARMMREDPNGYRILQEKRKQTRELEEINRKLKQ